jgi:phosphosulfolactate synthase (CoM biosynthesis protein A)
MSSIHYIDAEKVRKVINKMKNLAFNGIEISDGSMVQIDIRYTDVNPYSKAEGYVFVDKK